MDIYMLFMMSTTMSMLLRSVPRILSIVLPYRVHVGILIVDMKQSLTGIMSITSTKVNYTILMAIIVITTVD